MLQQMTMSEFGIEGTVMQSSDIKYCTELEASTAEVVTPAFVRQTFIIKHHHGCVSPVYAIL